MPNNLCVWKVIVVIFDRTKNLLMNQKEKNNKIKFAALSN